MGITIAVILIAFPFWRSPASAWQFIAGFATVLAGVSLRFWAIRQIGGSARKTSRLKAVRLINWGPFSLVRNPIYIANATIFAGFSILSGLLWMFPVVLVAFWFWYDAVVRREEAFLGTTFPVEYPEYLRTTGRWIPKLHFRNRPADVPPYPFLRILRRERGLVIGVSVGTSIVLLFRWLLSQWLLF